MVPLHREGLGSIFTDFSAQEGCSAAGQAERGHFPWLGGTLCNTNREVEGGRWVQRVGREKGHDVPGPFTAAPTQPVSAGSLHSAPGPQSIIVPRHAESTCGTAFWEPKWCLTPALYGHAEERSLSEVYHREKENKTANKKSHIHSLGKSLGATLRVINDQQGVSPPAAAVLPMSFFQPSMQLPENPIFFFLGKKEFI